MSLQHKILIAYIIAVAVICTYVPWEARHGRDIIPADYAFIWNQPVYYTYDPNAHISRPEKELNKPRPQQPKILSLEEELSKFRQQSSSSPEKLPIQHLTITGIDMKRIAIPLVGATAITVMSLLITKKREQR